MSAPTKKVKKVVPNPQSPTDIYDIVPTMMTDSTGTYKAELPTLQEDDTIELKPFIAVLGVDAEIDSEDDHRFIHISERLRNAILNHRDISIRANGEIVANYRFGSWQLIDSLNVAMYDSATTIEYDSTLDDTVEVLNLMFYVNTGSASTDWIIVNNARAGIVSDIKINNVSILSGGIANIQTEGTYNASTNKIATMNDLPRNYFYGDIDDLEYDSSTNRYLIATSSLWRNFLDNITDNYTIKIGDFVYAINFNVAGDGMIVKLFEVADIQSVNNTLTAYLSSCEDYAEQSSGFYYSGTSLNAVGNTTTVAISNIQVNTRNSANTLHENDVIIDGNKKVGFVVQFASESSVVVFTALDLSGTVVSGNTGATPSVTLTDLQIGSTVYAIPQVDYPVKDVYVDGSSVVDNTTKIAHITLPSGALKFLGTTTTAISDGSTTNPITINGQSVTATGGCVVLYNNKEYLWNDSITTPAWEEFGDENSFALKTTTITGTGVLGGGGALSSNQTITHNQVNTSGAKTTKGIYQVKIDAYGHITEATIDNDVIHTSNTSGLVKNDGTIDTTQYTTNTGTVTSVGMSVPTGFTLSGSPITTSGTFNIALASGYELLNSNSAQTIAGEKLFTSPLTLYNSSNGDTPLLIFRRGELTDNYNDWAIVDSAGLLYLKQRGSGSTDWSDSRVIFAQAYTDIKGEIKENGTSLASKYVRVDTNAQGLTDTQKSNARTNIGAGTSSFSGDYDDLTNKPDVIVKSSTSGLVKNDGTIDTTTYLDTTTASDTYVPIDSSNAKGHFRNNTTYTEMSFEDGTNGSSAITLNNIISLIAADSNNMSGIALLKSSILFQAPDLKWKTSDSATAKTLATINDITVTDVTLDGTSVLDNTVAEFESFTDTEIDEICQGAGGQGVSPVLDVKVDNTSVVNNGVANIETLSTEEVNAICSGAGSNPSGLQNMLLNYIYPIGSIYMSVNNVSPENFLGGTWQQLKDRFLLGAGDTYSAGATGGEANHTLTELEMPVHNHVGMWQGDGVPYSRGGAQGTTTSFYLGSTYNTVMGSNAFGDHTGNAGGSWSHNNMPPYLTVYMWKRTA